MFEKLLLGLLYKLIVEGGAEVISIIIAWLRFLSPEGQQKVIAALDEHIKNGNNKTTVV
ncbi:MAG: hypothetical protein MUP81_03700 [Dehalococcoidia bacterium]|nr:hypothetical protein [Dehalococcoidia bacterium]